MDVPVWVGIPESVGNGVRAELGVEDWVGVEPAAGVKGSTGCVERAAGVQATSIPTRTDTTNFCFVTIVLIMQEKGAYLSKYF